MNNPQPMTHQADGLSLEFSMCYLTIIRRRRSEYLVNKPLPAAGISADNVRG